MWYVFSVLLMLVGLAFTFLGEGEGKIFTFTVALGFEFMAALIFSLAEKPRFRKGRAAKVLAVWSEGKLRRAVVRLAENDAVMIIPIGSANVGDIIVGEE